MGVRARKRRQWRKLVQEHAASGLTQAEFCRLRGLSVKQLQRWRSKLRDELQLDGGGGAVEIVVAPAPSAPVTSTLVMLQLGPRCQLSFAVGTETNYLADLAFALQRRGPC